MNGYMSGIACLNCGFSMIQRGCKVRCPRCGIFFDCSDGMLPLYESEGTEADPRKGERKLTVDDASRPQGG
jgi:hypothetical protein